jgi:phosphoribosylaminoimidazolecarboxamide formyltransferase/IMP cyclohydrolase
MATNFVKVGRALISVSDKNGITDFASVLYELNPDITILSSGGTYKHLKPESEKRGYKLTEVAEYTGFPESPGGLLKTLHPRVHGAHLLNLDNPEHAKYMNENGIIPTDLVVVNLYPFQKKVEEGAPIDVVRENIDIGGPSMIRSAAKNFLRVAVIVDPAQYAEVLKELRETGGNTKLKTRIALADRAFSNTAEYDSAIAKFFKDHPAEEIATYYLKGN